MELLYQKDSFQKQNNNLLLKQMIKNMSKAEYYVSVDCLEDSTLETCGFQLVVEEFMLTFKIMPQFS